MATLKEDKAMNEQVIERLRQHVRSNSEAIFKIKQETKPYIHPKHQAWKAYRGHKYETTKWLIALHIARGHKDRIKSHAKDGSYILRVASKALKALEEKAKKELCHV
jgi:hypothetical protein